jgi:D-alanyl-D-alanine dipeptidase
MTLLTYEHIPIFESGEPLVNLAPYGFELVPAYYDAGISETPTITLRESVAERLATVREELSPLNLKIWDGWRPREVQHQIYLNCWNEMKRAHPDWSRAQLKAQVETFVTNATDANRIPLHATGGSVDLTLVDQDGAELDMGTPFDHFGPEAASLFYEHSGRSNQAACTNRRILRDALRRVDFRFDDDEWWHFDYGNQIWASALGKPHAIYGEANAELLRI